MCMGQLEFSSCLALGQLCLLAAFPPRPALPTGDLADYASHPPTRTRVWFPLPPLTGRRVTDSSHPHLCVVWGSQGM